MLAPYCGNSLAQSRRDSGCRASAEEGARCYYIDVAFDVVNELDVSPAFLRPGSAPVDNLPLSFRGDRNASSRDSEQARNNGRREQTEEGIGIASLGCTGSRLWSPAKLTKSGFAENKSSSGSCACSSLLLSEQTPSACVLKGGVNDKGSSGGRDRGGDNQASVEPCVMGWCSPWAEQVEGDFYVHHSMPSVFSSHIVLAACIFLFSFLVQFVLLSLAGNIMLSHISHNCTEVWPFSQVNPVGESAATGDHVSAAEQQSSSRKRAVGQIGYHICTDGRSASSASPVIFSNDGLFPQSVLVCNVLYLVFLFFSLLRFFFLTPRLASAVIIRFCMCVSIAFIFRGVSSLLVALTRNLTGDTSFPRGGDRGLRILLDATGLWTFHSVSTGICPISSQGLVVWILVSFWGFYTSKRFCLAFIVAPGFGVFLSICRLSSVCELIGDAVGSFFVCLVCIHYHVLLDLSVRRYVSTKSFSRSADCVSTFRERCVGGDTLIEVVTFVEALSLRLDYVMCGCSRSCLACIQLQQPVCEEDASPGPSFESRIVLAYAGSGDFDATNFRAVVRTLVSWGSGLVQCLGRHTKGNGTQTALGCEVKVFAFPSREGNDRGISGRRCLNSNILFTWSEHVAR